MGIYKKTEYESANRTGITVSGRTRDTVVNRRPKLPGSVIVVHGVNDVGTSYEDVEQGLCAGLARRLCSAYVPAAYRIPKQTDRDKLLADPDDIFFKRGATDKTFSPVIPFYWGYSEIKTLTTTRQGQVADRYGNRLDLDGTKGGGPFGNATNSLPDMWNRGVSWRYNISSDATRPLFSTPARMYMILAARRLAALIAMIRDYDADETVTVIGHSQGCMVTLLAQAFLKEEGCRPADTLILTHPPYSLEDNPRIVTKSAESYRNGEDAAMHGRYDALDGWQNLRARLQTLVNTVHTVTGQNVKPLEMKAFLTPGSPGYGTVGATWDPSKERDNRRKVYLYFCPQDMTVALDNMQGIGWQGVPDFMEGNELIVGRAAAPDSTSGGTRHNTGSQTLTLKSSDILNFRRAVHQPLLELGSGFFQRVFTDKRRLNPRTGKSEPVLVGAAPHDYALRIRGEDDQAHVTSGNRTLRDHFPEADWPVRHASGAQAEQDARTGIRSITGEALPKPVEADLRGTQQIDRPDGPYEAVDPIDATIAVASGKGIRRKWVLMTDPTGSEKYHDEWAGSEGSPDLATYSGPVRDANTLINKLREILNHEKPAGQICDVFAVYKCLSTKKEQGLYQLLVSRSETPDEARLRWQQHEATAKSFHGSIIGSSANHEHVTAYDVAIGQGTAVSDPQFYAYLCAVADWRLKKPIQTGRIRPSIMQWDQFMTKFKVFWASEPKWRKDLIEGNCDYYSSGILPSCLPVLPNQLPVDVVAETTSGRRMEHTAPATVKKP